MNVVRGDHIVEHRQTEAFFCLEKPVQIAAPRLSSADGGSFVFFQQRLERSEAVERLERLERDSLLVSEAVERLERLERASVLFGSRHRFVLRGSVSTGKTCF